MSAETWAAPPAPFAVSPSVDARLEALLAAVERGGPDLLVAYAEHGQTQALLGVGACGLLTLLLWVGSAYRLSVPWSDDDRSTRRTMCVMMLLIGTVCAFATGSAWLEFAYYRQVQAFAEGLP